MKPEKETEREMILYSFKMIFWSDKTTWVNTRKKSETIITLTILVNNSLNDLLINE